MVGLGLNSARVRGFSMVELLCSIALSLLLVTGVIATMVSSSASLRSSEQSSRLEERGWLALSILARDIRAAGFNGCARSPPFEGSSLNNAENLQWRSLDAGLQGYESDEVARSSMHAKHFPGAIHDSDILVVHVPKYGVGPLRLRTSMSSPAEELDVIGDRLRLSAGDVAQISDCHARSYFVVSAFSGSKIRHEAETSGRALGNARASLGYTFQRGAEIVPIQTIAYYIRAERPDKPRSMWRRVGLDEPKKVVDDVERMELQFGVDDNEDGLIDRYCTASEVINWRSVRSVSVALVLRSSEGIDAEEAAPQLLEGNVEPDDKRLTRVFSSTISIRNRAR